MILSHFHSTHTHTHCVPSSVSEQYNNKLEKSFVNSVQEISRLGGLGYLPHSGNTKNVRLKAAGDFKCRMCLKLFRVILIAFERWNETATAATIGKL